MLRLRDRSVCGLRLAWCRRHCSHRRHPLPDRGSIILCRSVSSMPRGSVCSMARYVLPARQNYCGIGPGQVVRCVCPVGQSASWSDRKIPTRPEPTRRRWQWRTAPGDGHEWIRAADERSDREPRVERMNANAARAAVGQPRRQGAHEAAAARRSGTVVRHQPQDGTRRSTIPPPVTTSPATATTRAVVLRFSSDEKASTG
jgi:hypothetical protein